VVAIYESISTKPAREKLKANSYAWWLLENKRRCCHDE
jgi:hypothetical protein